MSENKNNSRLIHGQVLEVSTIDGVNFRTLREKPIKALEEGDLNLAQQMRLRILAAVNSGKIKGDLCDQFEDIVERNFETFYGRYIQTLYPEIDTNIVRGHLEHRKLQDLSEEEWERIQVMFVLLEDMKKDSFVYESSDLISLQSEIEEQRSNIASLEKKWEEDMQAQDRNKSKHDQVYEAIGNIAKSLRMTEEGQAELDVLLESIMNFQEEIEAFQNARNEIHNVYAEEGYQYPDDALETLRGIRDKLKELKGKQKELAEAFQEKEASLLGDEPDFNAGQAFVVSRGFEKSDLPEGIKERLTELQRQLGLCETLEDMYKRDLSGLEGSIDQGNKDLAKLEQTYKEEVTRVKGYQAVSIESAEQEIEKRCKEIDLAHCF